MVSLLIEIQSSFTPYYQAIVTMMINMMAASLQSEPSAIYRYIVLATYRLLMCQVSGFASAADEVATDLRTRHRDIQP
jgi:hypothetical protein